MATFKAIVIDKTEAGQTVRLADFDEDPSTGEIYATGMTPSSPPVNGHLNTLQGDYGVGSSSPLAKESPVILCSFPS